MGLTAIQESKTLVFKEQKPRRARGKRGNTQVLSSPEIRRNEPNQGKTTEIRRLTRLIQSTIPIYCLEYIMSCASRGPMKFLVFYVTPNIVMTGTMHL